MRKVALITGAAKRLGAQTSRHLHALGFDVLIHYHQSAEQAKALANELNLIRPKSAQTICHDLSDIANLSLISDYISQHYQRLDVLVNNASTFYPTPLTELNFSDYNDLMVSNMTAPLFLTKTCLGLLRETHGTVVNMCDIHASRPLKDHSVYCMAKAGLVMMTHSLANELAPEIRVNGIAPGAIEWPSNGISESDMAKVLTQIPLGRKGQAHDIASAIGYLVQADYITGQILTVDGGRQHNASQGA